MNILIGFGIYWLFLIITFLLLSLSTPYGNMDPASKFLLSAMWPLTLVLVFFKKA